MINSTDSSASGQAIPQDPLSFLRLLYGDDAPGWLTISTFDTQPTQWFPAHQLEQVSRYCLTIAHRYNVYFGLGIRQEQLKEGRGESDDVRGIPGLWIEIDLKHPVHKKVNLPETIDETMALVREAIPLRPSLMILSGYGIHVYWLFRELWLFEDADERQAAGHLLHRLQATIQTVAKLHGWGVDSTFDLARVLRIPGTFNRNVPHDPKRVEILEADADRRYNPSDFDEHLIEVDETAYEQTTSEEYAGDLPPIDLQTLNIPVWLKYLIHVGHDPDYQGKHPSRSEAHGHATEALLKAGIETPTIMSLLLDPRYAISERPREKGRTWLAGDIARIRAKMNGHQQRSASAPGPETSEAQDDERRTSEHGAHQAAPTPATTLADVEQTFRKWLHLPDLGPLYVVLGTYAANRMAGDPLWTMLIGGSGWGKTELLMSLTGLPHVHVASTMTEASLLSGTSRKEKGKDATGGLLQKIGEFGYLVCKDFTSVLSMNRESSTTMLAALREIFDGAWTRHIGVDGGRTLHWAGKLCLIAGCTGAIDRYHAVVGALGERFLSYRLQTLEADQQGHRALELAGHEKSMREELSGAVSHLFVSSDIPERPMPLDANEKDALVALATLAARCRSSVERDSYRREIELILDPEAPARLALSLLRLYAGMRAIGVTPERARPLIMKVGLGCMPAIRRAVFTRMVSDEQKWETAELATKLGYPTQTARRTMEDLTAHGIVVRQKNGKADQWNLSDLADSLYRRATKVFPDIYQGDSDDL